MRQIHSDEKFIETWKRLQSPTAVARALNMDTRNVHDRRGRMQSRYNIQLPTVHKSPNDYTATGHIYQPQESEISNSAILEIPSFLNYAVPGKELVKKYKTHCVIPDVQSKAGVPLDHLEWAGKYIAEKKPDVKGNEYRRHLIFKHEVCAGRYDLMEVSLEFLRRKYA